MLPCFLFRQPRADQLAEQGIHGYILRLPREDNRLLKRGFEELIRVKKASDIHDSAER